MRKKHLRAENERLRQQLRDLRTHNAALVQAYMAQKPDPRGPRASARGGPATRWPSPAYDPQRTRPV